ncbi:hypothetical protein G6F60_014512 [Rhizopus arrhizus]|nr:hypothetical protein G6F60_014512 [Rhizopus arrhizus]
MIKTTPLQPALIAALLGSVALVGCKKKEDAGADDRRTAADGRSRCGQRLHRYRGQDGRRRQVGCTGCPVRTEG